ncbi:hypothetical protein BS78_K100100 [Paspalum vaginatum]|uniref:High-affinity nitrate transporter n=1 Tax=Paspalum vaginatum TaxID=158149 RepID=A0A9W7X896_9POAL|nr:hypothetical protein BS78_K100100 [Paspalum vaginatum]
MGRRGVALALLLLLGACLTSPAAAAVHLSTLPKALAVTASPRRGQVLHSGVDSLTVTWSLNTSEPAGADAAYKDVKVSLCFAPESQKDRGWRKSDDDLSKDKACQFKVTQQAYAAAAGGPGSFQYTVARDSPLGLLLRARLRAGRVRHAGGLRPDRPRRRLQHRRHHGHPRLHQDRRQRLLRLLRRHARLLLRHREPQEEQVDHTPHACARSSPCRATACHART